MFEALRSVSRIRHGQKLGSALIGAITQSPELSDAVEHDLLAGNAANVVAALDETTELPNTTLVTIS